MTAIRPPCPRCSGRAIPIMYGYPSDAEAAFAAEERGEIVVGGCVIGDDSPVWQCADCAERYGRLTDLR